MVDVWGMEWIRDNDKQTFTDVLELGFVYFKNKYENEIARVECSRKDLDEEIVRHDVKVIPVKTRLSNSFLFCFKENDKPILREKKG